MDRKLAWTPVVPTETSAETQAGSTQRGNYKISPNVSAEQITTNARKLFERWTYSWMNLSNIDQLSSIVLSHRSEIEFSGKTQVKQYENFLQNLETILGEFNSGIQNKVEQHICYSGDRDEALFQKTLNAELNGALDDLEMAVEDNGIFNSIFERLATEGLRRIKTIYESENTAIVNIERDLAKQAFDGILISFKLKVLKYMTKASGPNNNIDVASNRLIQHCLKAFQASFESQGKINDVANRAAERLQRLLQDEYRKQTSSSGVSLTSSSNPKAQSTSCNSNLQQASGKANSTLLGPIIFYINRNFDVVTAISEAPENPGYKILVYQNNTLTPGQIAYSHTDKTFHIGSNADQYVGCRDDRALFYHLFELICSDDMGPKFRDHAIKNFFLHLKDCAERSRAVIILPEWVPEKSQKLLKAVLEKAVFSRVEFIIETTAIAVGYILDKYPVGESKRSNRALLVFKVLHEYIQVKIFRLTHTSEDSPIQCVAANHNRMKIRENLLNWFDRRDRGQISEITWNVATLHYRTALNQFQTACVDLGWSSPTVDALIVTNNKAWARNLSNLLIKDYANVINCDVAAWEALLLRGAALLSFPDARKINQWLHGNHAASTMPPPPTYSGNVANLALETRKKELKSKCDYLINYVLSPRVIDDNEARQNVLGSIEAAKYAARNEFEEKVIRAHENIIEAICQQFHQLVSTNLYFENYNQFCLISFLYSNL